MSTMFQEAGTLSAGRVLYSLPRVTSLATTTSVGRTILVPCFSADSMIAFASSIAVGLDQALADRLALGEQEGVGHAAADHEHVDLVDEVAQDLDLARDLGPADDRREGSLRVLHQLAQELDLLLHQQAGVRRQELGDAFRARRGRGGRCRRRR